MNKWSDPFANTSGPDPIEVQAESTSDLLEKKIINESKIKGRLGYARSETRSLSERHLVVEQIRRNLGLPSLTRPSREHAIELGRRYGEDEAAKRAEEGSDREQRICRAKAYAAWEYDGKPVDCQQKYNKEFAITSHAIPRSVRHIGQDLRPSEKKK